MFLVQVAGSPHISKTNHDASPNVSFVLDTPTESIRYITSRKIHSGEELFIFYGHNLWFKSAGSSEIFMNDVDESTDDTWGGLNEIREDENPYSNGKKDEVIPEEELPVVRTKITPDEEEDASDTIATSMCILCRTLFFYPPF